MILFILGCSITLNIVLILALIFIFKFKDDDLFLMSKSKGELEDVKQSDEFDKILKEKKEDRKAFNYFFGNSK